MTRISIPDKAPPRPTDFHEGGGWWYPSKQGDSIKGWLVGNEPDTIFTQGINLYVDKLIIATHQSEYWIRADREPGSAIAQSCALGDFIRITVHRMDDILTRDNRAYLVPRFKWEFAPGTVEKREPIGVKSPQMTEGETILADLRDYDFRPLSDDDEPPFVS